MALFDSSIFDPQTYQGGMAGNSWLLQALQNGLLSRGGISADVTPTGPTYARGNEGMMGGVPFPIAAKPDLTTELSAQSQQQSASPAAVQPAPQANFSNVFGVGAQH